jgi:hypothetical protein
MNREEKGHHEAQWEVMLDRVEEIVSILEERYNCRVE